MIDIVAMRKKYAKSGKYAKAGAKDVRGLCDELETKTKCLTREQVRIIEEIIEDLLNAKDEMEFWNRLEYEDILPGEYYQF